MTEKKTGEKKLSGGLDGSTGRGCCASLGVGDSRAAGVASDGAPPGARARRQPQRTRTHKHTQKKTKKTKTKEKKNALPEVRTKTQHKQGLALETQRLELSQLPAGKGTK